MTVEEYADALNLELEIRRYPNQDGRYTAQFANCDMKERADDGCLTGAYGNGKSPSQAIADYIQQIEGKILVVGAGTDYRRQYLVPKGMK